MNETIVNSESQQVGASLLSIEANIVIAGLEGVAIGWTLFYERGKSPYVLSAIRDLVPNLGSDGLNAAVYAVFALLAIVIVGFVVEGVAGILETIVTRRWWGKGGKYWGWYAVAIDEKIRERAQSWIWKTDLAHQDFSRRRLRILVARNTACCFVILTLGSISIVQYGVLALCAGISILFSYLWIDARKGYRNDIENIGKYEP